MAAQTRAALLDAEFERLVAMVGNGSLPGEAATLGRMMAALRDRVVLWSEQMRAGGPLRQPAVAGSVMELSLPTDLTAELISTAEASPIDWAELPQSLTDRVRAALGHRPAITPPTPTMKAAATREAAAAVGRARFLEAAFDRNDTDLAERSVAAFEQESGLKIEASLRPVVLRYALKTLAEAARENGRRRRGEYPPLEVDPLSSLNVGRFPSADITQTRGNASVSPHPSSLPQLDRWATSNANEAALITSTPPDLAPRISQAMAEAIRRLGSRTREPIAAKQLADYDVAGRLLIGICGDIRVSDITLAVCEAFVDGLTRTPSVHGKGETYRGMTALDATRAADKADLDALQAAIKSGADPDQIRSIPRLSIATINKHLTSLQTCLGDVLPTDKKGRTPFIASRFSKAAVRANPTMNRRQLTDDRLEAIFHGPVFTGFGDDEEDRFSAGERLLRDARYWVPLLGLYGGERLEELLQLRPDDVERIDGIHLISIGAVHNGRPGAVKTVSSVRKVPVHSALIRLGMLDYVSATRATGSTLLFPGVRRGGADARFSHTFTKWWTSYRRAVGAYARGQDFHSMRHGVNTKLLARKVPESTIRTLLGHSQGNSMTGGTYNSGLSHPELAEAMEELQYPALDLERLIDASKRL